jgi:hypothetical protein
MASPDFWSASDSGTARTQDLKARLRTLNVHIPITYLDTLYDEFKQALIKRGTPPQIASSILPGSQYDSHIVQRPPTDMVYCRLTFQHGQIMKPWGSVFQHYFSSQ